MKTDTCILNQLNLTPGHDGWMHACPLGEHEWRSEDGKEVVIQVIDTDAAREIASHYPPEDVRDAMIDWEHESMTANGRTEAAGWGRKAEVRDDGVWVQVEWSDTGRQAVDGKRFKFNSPCFHRSGLVHLEGNRYRVTRMGRIALTNNPNLSGQKPLTNRRTDSPPANPEHKPKNTMDYKTMLLTLLGLPADATDDQIASAVTAMRGEKTEMENARKRITELETQLVNTDLDAHGITDVNQRNLFTPLLANKSTRDEALKTLGALKSKTGTAPATIHNRAGAPVPGTDKQLSNADADAAAEKKRADWIGNRARELQSANSHRPHRECFAQAESEYLRNN